MFGVKPPGKGHYLLKHLQNRIVFGIHMLLAFKHHAESRKNEEGPENIENPFEALEQRHAGQNENKAHHNGAKDSEEQDAGLVFGGHFEEAEDQDKHKHIVY